MAVRNILITLFSVFVLMPMTAVAGKLEPVGAVPVPAGNPQTLEKIELGKKLFFDRRLSGDGTMSCSTCHDPEKGYSDGLADIAELSHDEELAELTDAYQCRLPEAAVS